jgi:hypothetical protein
MAHAFALPELWTCFFFFEIYHAQQDAADGLAGLVRWRVWWFDLTCARDGWRLNGACFALPELWTFVFEIKDAVDSLACLGLVGGSILPAPVTAGGPWAHALPEM